MFLHYINIGGDLLVFNVMLGFKRVYVMSALLPLC